MIYFSEFVCLQLPIFLFLLGFLFTKSKKNVFYFLVKKRSQKRSLFFSEKNQEKKGDIGKKKSFQFLLKKMRTKRKKGKKKGEN